MDTTMNTEVDESLDLETSSANIDESTEEVDTAEHQESVVEENPQQNEEIDRNAIFADARRRAEKEYRDRKANEDAEFVRRFGHLNNPITGQPIRSKDDYLKALDAQEELRAKAELEKNGVDPKILDNAIANNPLVRQAQMVMEQANRQQVYSAINNDIAELGKLDPSITSLETVPPAVIEMSMQSGGNINLVNAYKILNYGKVSDSKQAELTQSAINQAKGKQHLNPVNGVATPDDGVEIPSSELAMWKDMFPDKSTAELKKLYNKTL